MKQLTALLSVRHQLHVLDPNNLYLARRKASIFTPIQNARHLRGPEGIVSGVDEADESTAHEVVVNACAGAVFEAELETHQEEDALTTRWIARACITGVERHERHHSVDACRGDVDRGQSEIITLRVAEKVELGCIILELDGPRADCVARFVGKEDGVERIRNSGKGICGPCREREKDGRVDSGGCRKPTPGRVGAQRFFVPARLGRHNDVSEG